MKTQTLTVPLSGAQASTVRPSFTTRSRPNKVDWTIVGLMYLGSCTLMAGIGWGAYYALDWLERLV